ncbi:tetratricopeptide (TPR) repeat protein/SAM-dependent methyltransferase [Methylorubrum rhodinum]|uniref:Tetratricopeptide (TPR) repeat protein/SAM-dependent methyltransferase n=2 Tax=Methylorubrum TaxID=2282523 RepID=A0A840ZMU2_9HYPH|nr:class I SAM-dependent methyltransferase [Methylorubrum rhodinum]MBB5758650.1 tetratricopeptide (TPR) repeat protein/SAM-dependent methyltransferase [Methylorubrum rhodinum]
MQQKWVRSGDGTFSGAGPSAALALRRAAEALNAGRLDEAEHQARSVLATRPQEPGALYVLGCVALNRGRPEEALVLFERVRATQSKDPQLHFNLGEAHRRTGAPASALRHFRKAAELSPGFAETHGQAGEMLRALGRFTEAAKAYQSALMLKPDLAHCLAGFALLLVREDEFGQAVPFFEAALRATPATMAQARAPLWANLGSARIRAGDTPAGLSALAEAVACAPDEADFRRLLARELLHVGAVPAGPRFRTVLIGLFQRPDIDPRLLATAAVAALRQDPAVDGLLARLASDPAQADETVAEAGATVRVLLDDELFRALLSATPIPDLGLELLLTDVRRSLLVAARDGALPGLDLAFVCALARQCFLNEYVYWTDEPEDVALAALCAGLDQAGDPAGGADWHRVALSACYVALHRTAAARLDFGAAPPALQALAREQVEEPAQERALADGLVPLRPVRDPVSLAVQSQYEENPYPRWSRALLGTPRPLRERLGLALPHLGADELPATERPRVLVAGCGTGIQTMRIVQSVAHASVLAVDLSRSSLAYGMRKLAGYGVGSVRHLQADILDLADLNERFDLIESFGVLHHMREPLEGLRILSGLLVPGGLLFLGLYSEIARASVVAGRALVAELALAPTPAGVRAGRRAVMTRAATLPDLGMLLSPASDF